ncbi:MAG: MopE-related protein, partial [Pseudomonadota bacterium]
MGHPGSFSSLRLYLLVGALLAPAGARGAESFEGHTFYLGDPHVHTGISGDGHSADLGAGCGAGCGALADALDIAQDNGLDWVSFTDHVNGAFAASPVLWTAFFRDVLAHDDEGTGLVVVPGAELWLVGPSGNLGHRNLMLFGSDSELAGLRFTDTLPLGSTSSSIPDCGTLETWLEGLQATYGDLLLVPHHSWYATPMEVDWTCLSEPFEPIVEVYSSWGESLGGPLGYEISTGRTVATGAVHYALDPDGLALRMGFWGGTDSHYTCPGDLCSTLTPTGLHVSTGGLTLVAVPEGEPWDRQAIYEASLARRVLATSGPALPVALEFSSDGALLGTLGEDLSLPAGEALDAEVRVPAAWAASVLAVYLVSMDDTWELAALDSASWGAAIPAEEVPEWLYLAVQIDGPTAAGSAWCDDGNGLTEEWVWASPSWIELVDLDGDGVTADEGDCDDEDDAISPALDEVCDGLDNDCDGTVDEPDASDAGTWYPDADGDGWGEASSPALACTAPAGHVAEPGDCDDGDPAFHPGAPEDCTDPTDYDCDGVVLWADDDWDGWAACLDCDDEDPWARPDGVERCDTRDNDCDGTIDEPDAVDAPTWHLDLDGDGWGAPATSLVACSAPSGWVADAGDCDDADALVNPDGVERCDTKDNDCDGTIDEPDAVDAAIWRADRDGDGWGDPGSGVVACVPPTGWVLAQGDCDDADAGVNPGQRERCDGRDDDCDGAIDGPDPVDAATWHADLDGDGWGDPASSVKACEPPPGYLADARDCDDADAEVNPGQRERCDSKDDDCDGMIDEPDALDARAWCLDRDGDGWGDPNAVTIACAPPRGFVADATDCDDEDAGVHPEAEDAPGDGVDQDCDGADAPGDGSCAGCSQGAPGPRLGLLLGGLALA